MIIKAFLDSVTLRLEEKAVKSFTSREKKIRRNRKRNRKSLSPKIFVIGTKASDASMG